MPSTAVGLDVGSHALKVLALEETPTALRLVSYGSAPCPEGAILDGAVADPHALGAALEGLFSDH
ncbi:MAG: pilus assembly protein PilM, partial [Candidatus Tectimicrobiota bacterium]